MRVRLLAALLLASLARPGLAGDPVLPEELKPRPVKLSARNATLKELLSLLQKDSGNLAADHRITGKDDPVSVDLNAPFWPALDALAQQAGCAVSLFHTPGLPVLVNGPSKLPHVSYDGIFRVTPRRLSLGRDFEDGNRLCRITLAAAWEPRFKPFYIETEKATAEFADAGKTRVEARGEGKIEVTHPMRAELTLSFPAPPRACPAIATVKGGFQIIGPTRMLTFSFDKLNAIKDAQPSSIEGVKVTLGKPSVGPDRWIFKLEIDNAPGVPTFESYQSWLGNNEVYLQKDKEIWPANSEEQETLDIRAERAVIRCHFTDAARLKNAKLADWKLVVTTPHRIVALPVRYEFKNIELP